MENRCHASFEIFTRTGGHALSCLYPDPSCGLLAPNRQSLTDINSRKFVNCIPEDRFSQFREKVNEAGNSFPYFGCVAGGFITDERVEARPKKKADNALLF